MRVVTRIFWFGAGNICKNTWNDVVQQVEIHLSFCYPAASTFRSGEMALCSITGIKISFIISCIIFQLLEMLIEPAELLSLMFVARMS